MKWQQTITIPKSGYKARHVVLTAEASQGLVLRPYRWQGPHGANV
jgi:hypothetical protein